MILKTIKSELGAFLKQRQRMSSSEQTITDIRNDLLNVSSLSLIANEIKSRVVERTLSGFDYRNKAFIPYSPSYAKFKGVGVNDVNLQLTGQMLRDFYVEVKLRPEYTNNDIFFIDLGYLSIHYGFKTETSIDRYFWNADNQYGKNRDFLGASIGVPLLPSKELLNIIETVIGTRSSQDKRATTRQAPYKFENISGSSLGLFVLVEKRESFNYELAGTIIIRNNYRLANDIIQSLNDKYNTRFTTRSNFLYIESLQIHSKYAGEGYGSLLLDEFIRKHYNNIVLVFASPFNHENLGTNSIEAFYARRGFNIFYDKWMIRGLN
jgi:GNAT superfamily N-acetyltransferase